MTEYEATLTILYADFPGLGDRWEREMARVVTELAGAHAAFAETIAKHLGERLHALVDARCARFADMDQAVVAAVSFRRLVVREGRLVVRIALTAGDTWPDGEVPMELYNRARMLAEGIRSNQLLLSATVVRGVADNLPEGTCLRRSFRRLREIGKWERAALLEESRLTKVDVDKWWSRGTLPAS